jgi:phosphodiesterase/alkaline phosphatase D-like protein
MSGRIAEELTAFFLQMTAFNSGSSLVAGALTDTSFAIRADLVNPTTTVQLEVRPANKPNQMAYRSPALASFAGQGTKTTYHSVAHEIPAGSLAPNMSYGYQLVSRNEVLIGPYTLRTAPPARLPASFAFGFGSCSRFVGAYDTKILRSHLLDDPLFFMHLGDLDYSNIDNANLGRIRDRNMRQFLKSRDAQAFVRQVPLFWMPDNHDRGYQNSRWNTRFDSGIRYAESVQASGQVYRETSPHYPFAFPSTYRTNAVLAQQFTVGRVRFLVPDLRAQVNFQAREILGSNKGYEWENQEAWLLAQLLQAKTDGMALIFLVSTSGWYGADGDSWGKDFDAQRRRVIDFIAANNLPPVWVLMGDIHQSGIDDGSNGVLPTVASSPIKKGPSTALVPFSFGGIETSSRGVGEQITTIKVTDTGGSLSSNPITLDVAIKGGSYGADGSAKLLQHVVSNARIGA